MKCSKRKPETMLMTMMTTTLALAGELLIILYIVGCNRVEQVVFMLPVESVVPYLDVLQRGF
jgi:hypothetical protein